jgi:hypothetical protein
MLADGEAGSLPIARVAGGGAATSRTVHRRT